MQNPNASHNAHDDLVCDVVLEQTLGHVTHGQNLRRLLDDIDGFHPRFVPIVYDNNNWTRRLPGFGNWTVRAGLRARRALGGDHHRDAIFVHTQVPAVLLGGADVPTIVSLDATPKQYDALGSHYGHDVASNVVERIKTSLNRRCFERAAHLVTWAHWTKQSLADDYDIDGSKVTVIPPGVDVERWARPADAAVRNDDSVVRILFVGGDLRRKGGFDLIRAFSTLHDRHGSMIELHLVTPTEVGPIPGATVHDSMTPNSPELIALYHRCDIFCLPTLGDCLPMVLPEAGAAGLALVSTNVGAIDEIVRDGDTGLLVEASDVRALAAALEKLIVDVQFRVAVASSASELVHSEHDAAVNAQRIVDVIAAAVSNTQG